MFVRFSMIATEGPGMQWLLQRKRTLILSNYFSCKEWWHQLKTKCASKWCTNQKWLSVWHPSIYFCKPSICSVCKQLCAVITESASWLQNLHPPPFRTCAQQFNSNILFSNNSQVAKDVQYSSVQVICLPSGYESLGSASRIQRPAAPLSCTRHASKLCQPNRDSRTTNREELQLEYAWGCPEGFLPQK